MGTEAALFPGCQPLFHHCSPSHQTSSQSSRKVKMEVTLRVKKIIKKKFSEHDHLGKSISVHPPSLLQKQERGHVWPAFHLELQLWVQLQELLSEKAHAQDKEQKRYHF